MIYDNIFNQAFADAIHALDKRGFTVIELHDHEGEINDKLKVKTITIRAKVFARYILPKYVNVTVKYKKGMHLLSITINDKS